MLHIILTILKIIGIILAVLLGFLLVVVLLVLFVPIGYSAELDNQKNLLVKANAWWLFHALSISFFYEKVKESLDIDVEQSIASNAKVLEEDKKSPVIKVKILGISIIDTSRKKEEKKEDVIYKEDLNTSDKKEEKEQKEIVFNETVLEDKSTELVTQELKKEPVLEETLPKTSNDKIEETKEKSSEKLDVSEEKENKKEKIKKEKKKEEELKKEKVEKQKNSEKQKFSFLIIKEKIQNIKQTIRNLLGKIELIKAFFQNEENKQGIGKIFSSIKNILKQLLPRQMKGNITFGMADPCATGQALGVLAVFYPYYGKSVFIEPDFSRQVLEGNLYLKGHIRIVTLCFIAIKLVLNANFRKLIKNVLKLKEELINGGK